MNGLFDSGLECVVELQKSEEDLELCILFCRKPSNSRP